MTMRDRDLERQYKTLGVTKPEADALTWALHLEEVLDGAACGTGRTLRLRTMRALEARGLMREQWAVLVDGDGFHVEPERERRCFALTDTGRELAKKVKAAEEAVSKARVAVAAANA